VVLGIHIGCFSVVRDINCSNQARHKMDSSHNSLSVSFKKSNMLLVQWYRFLYTKMDKKSQHILTNIYINKDILIPIFLNRRKCLQQHNNILPRMWILIAVAATLASIPLSFLWRNPLQPRNKQKPQALVFSSMALIPPTRTRPDHPTAEPAQPPPWPDALA